MIKSLFKCTTTTAEMFFHRRVFSFTTNKQNAQKAPAYGKLKHHEFVMHACTIVHYMLILSLVIITKFSHWMIHWYSHTEKPSVSSDERPSHTKIRRPEICRPVEKEMQNCSRTGGMRKKEANKSSYFFFCSVFSEHNPSKSCKTLKRFTWFSCYFSLPTRIHSLDVFFFLTFTVVLNSQLG